ncbi:MAG: sensor histidine kinase [Cellulomonas sp.]
MTGERPAAEGHRRGWDGWSLRLRLTLLTAGLLCVALIAGAIVLTTVLSRSRVAALDDLVQARARTIAALAVDDRLPQALPVAEPGEIAQLLDPAGQVIASSPNASRTLPVLPAAEIASMRAAAQSEPLARATSASAYDRQARVAVLATTYQGADATVVATVPLGEVQGLLRAVRVSLGVVVPLLTALLAGAIWIVLGRALHPVEQLRRAAAQVAQSGGPGALPVPRAHDELGALARTLNEMLDRIEVGAARQRAFVADAAHELRSPLASLRASIEVARAHPAAYPSAELAGDLEGEVLRMQGLVDDLLVLARVGSTPVVRADVDLARVTRVAADGARPAASRSGTVTIKMSGAGRAQGDEVAVGRVVRNLLDNAVRHAAARVRVSVADGVVVVEDDGNGVADADRERVFERFVRLEESREREAGGTGLGLAIAREIAREHGGDIVLADSPLGGLSATLRLPIS